MLTEVPGMAWGAPPTAVWNWLPLVVLVALYCVSFRTVPPTWVGLVNAALFTGYWFIAGLSGWYTVGGVMVISFMVAQTSRALYLARRDRLAAGAGPGGQP